MPDPFPSSKELCDGACCAAFYMPRKHMEVLANFPSVMEGDYIADMVIPLSTEEVTERRLRFGITEKHNISEGHGYTCRHWDEETTLCTAYEERPKMCRDYPYDKACEHCKCHSPIDVWKEWRDMKKKRKAENSNPTDLDQPDA